MSPPISRACAEYPMRPSLALLLLVASLSACAREPSQAPAAGAAAKASVKAATAMGPRPIVCLSSTSPPIGETHRTARASDGQSAKPQRLRHGGLRAGGHDSFGARARRGGRDKGMLDGFCHRFSRLQGAARNDRSRARRARRVEFFQVFDGPASENRSPSTALAARRPRGSQNRPRGSTLPASSRSRGRSPRRSALRNSVRTACEAEKLPPRARSKSSTASCDASAAATRPRVSRGGVSPGFRPEPGRRPPRLSFGLAIAVL